MRGGLTVSKRLEKLREREARLREQIRQEQARLRELERKRRTRALIILGTGWIELIASGRVDIRSLELVREALLVRERGRNLDLWPYVMSEVERAQKRLASDGGAKG
jgi:hypothetical protein